MGAAVSQYAFLTFLQGNRSCIGQSLEKAELTCLLATWVTGFEFELRDPKVMDEAGLEIRGHVIPRPANDLWVKARILRAFAALAITTLPVE